jgi:hypothetical protein
VARRRRHGRLHDEPRPMLHQQVPQVPEPRLAAARLLVQPCIGVGARISRVRSVDTSVSTTRRRSRSAGVTKTRRIELVVLQRVRSTNEDKSSEAPTRVSSCDSFHCGQRANRFRTGA